jgi:SAM-dependent methyltransferase
MPDTQSIWSGNAAYDGLARFYDELEGDRSKQADYLRGLLATHAPGAQSLLELACGTGAILRRLVDDYPAPVGVDISGPMLAAARAAVPTAELICEDIRNIALGRTFDVVLCVFDSINHLLEFADWEAVFDRAAEHLVPGGTFLFDMHTRRRLLELMEEPAHTKWFGDGHFLVIRVSPGAGRTDGAIATSWRIEIFERVAGDSYRLHACTIDEVSFDVDRIESTLRQRFSQVLFLDPEQKTASKDTRRLHVICKK